MWSDLGDILPRHPAAQDGLPIRRQRVRLVGDKGPHEQQAFAKTTEGVDKFVDVTAQRCGVGTVEQCRQLIGHHVDRKARLEPNTHSEMSAPRLRRGGFPNEIGARFEYLLVQRGDVLIFARDLTRPERPLECLV